MYVSRLLISSDDIHTPIFLPTNHQNSEFILVHDVSMSKCTVTLGFKLTKVWLNSTWLIINLLALEAR